MDPEGVFADAAEFVDPASGNLRPVPGTPLYRAQVRRGCDGACESGGHRRQPVQPELRRLQTPCPADTNGDGVVSAADFSRVAAFNADLPECDANGDGSCTPADFSARVAA